MAPRGCDGSVGLILGGMNHPGRARRLSRQAAPDQSHRNPPSSDRQ